MRKSKMFDKVTRTWNPVITYPCYHHCKYCWVHVIVEKYKLKTYLESRGKPILLKHRLREKFEPNDFVFVCDTSDLFAEVVPSEYIRRVIDVVKKFPKTTFLFLTKNPKRYCEFLWEFPENAILGITYETDSDVLYTKYKVSRAPTPRTRIEAMLFVKSWRPNLKRFISVEPIIDFNMEIMLNDILDVEPHIVYVGYDNYGMLARYGIPEPPLNKTLELIDRLKSHGIEVRVKTLRKSWCE